MTTTLSRKKLRAACFTLVGILTIFHIGSIILYFNFESAFVDQYVSFFDFGIEENLPTYFSSIFLFVAAAMMGLAGLTSKGRSAIGWSTLAAIFLLLSIDEITQIHEAVGKYFEGIIRAEGILYHVWVVPYSLLVAVLAAVYLPFYLSLPSDVKNRFIISGALYVGGALCLEMIGSIEASANGLETYTYTFLYSVEELCEMLGAVFFIDTAVLYLTRHSQMTLVFRDSESGLQAQHLPQSFATPEEKTEVEKVHQQSK